MAVAEPKGDVGERYRRATQLDDSGEYDAALAAIDEGLAIDPKEQRLLLLKGAVLVKQRDYRRALAAYRAYLDAGVTGANRREAQKIVENLQAAESTFLDVTLANGPAEIYLDSKSQGVFCRAAPTCNRPVLPGTYKVIAERPGFERWTASVTIDGGKTAKLAATLVEQPSQIKLRVTPAGAKVTVDSTTYDAQTAISVPAGPHRVTVALAGHRTEQREVVAAEGKPIALDVALAPFVPIRVDPPSAELLLDDRPIAIENGGIAIPAGAHTLVARAKGFVDLRVEIPSARGSDYRLGLQLARSWFTTQRKVALAVAGVGLAGVGTGAVLGLDGGQFRTRGSQLGYGIGGFTLAVAIALWIEGRPRPPVVRIAVVPRVGEVAGLALAVRF